MTEWRVVAHSMAVFVLIAILMSSSWVRRLPTPVSSKTSASHHLAVHLVQTGPAAGITSVGDYSEALLTQASTDPAKNVSLPVCDVCAHEPPRPDKKLTAQLLPSCCHPGGSWHRQCGAGKGHTFLQGVRVCNLRAGCAKCGVGQKRLAGGALDLNCCVGGGSWAGSCGHGRPFTYGEGFRTCHLEQLGDDDEQVGVPAWVAAPPLALSVSLAANETCAICPSVRHITDGTDDSSDTTSSSKASLRSCCDAGGSWHGTCSRHSSRTFAHGVRACNVQKCARCGIRRKSSGRADDLNCCHRGGSWWGRCGSLERFPFTAKEGYRTCNNVLADKATALEPSHTAGPFLPLSLSHQSGGNGNWTPASKLEGGLRLYCITLHSARKTLRRLRWQMRTQLHPSRVKVLHGVPADRALATAGVSSAHVEKVFGVQAATSTSFPPLPTR